MRLAAELLLLLGLLLLTLHITVLRSSPLPQANVTVSLDQDSALTQVSRTMCIEDWSGFSVEKSDVKAAFW